MPIYDLYCPKCGFIRKDFMRPMSAENPNCKCGVKMETVCNTASAAVWYTECPTASGGSAGSKKRIYGFVDDHGREHKVKYRHGTAVKNRFKTGTYSGDSDGTGRIEGDR